MDEPEERPIGDVLDGLVLHVLPAGWTPIDAACMVKCIDPDGRPKWAMRVTGGLSDEERIGALTLQLDLAKHDTLATWLDEDDD